MRKKETRQEKKGASRLLQKSREKSPEKYHAHNLFWCDKESVLLTFGFVYLWKSGIIHAHPKLWKPLDVVWGVRKCQEKNRTESFNT